MGIIHAEIKKTELMQEKLQENVDTVYRSNTELEQLVGDRDTLLLVQMACEWEK
jgi:hypothetical protein